MRVHLYMFGLLLGCVGLSPVAHAQEVHSRNVVSGGGPSTTNPQGYRRFSLTGVGMSMGSTRRAGHQAQHGIIAGTRRMMLSTVACENVVEYPGDQVIDSAGELDGDYNIMPRVPTTLDFSPSRDPSGAKLAYRYTMTAGLGRIRPSVGYPGGRGDWGPNPIVEINVDGERNAIVQVYTTKCGGQAEANRAYRLNILNTPPEIRDWDIRIERAPEVTPQDITVQSLGRRRYRISVQARLEGALRAYVDYDARDPFRDALVASADFDGDGVPDHQTEGNEGTIGSHVIPFESIGQRLEVELNVSDAHNTVSESKSVIIPRIDFGGRENDFRFFLDIGGDGAWEVNGARGGVLDFLVPGGLAEVLIVGLVRSISGELRFERTIVLPNNNPSLVSRVVSQEGFDVVVSAVGRDPDTDPLTYVIDWGDGTVTRSRGVIQRHTYPDGVFREYAIVVRAEDGRGGFAQAQHAIEVVEPVIREAELTGLRWQRITPTEGTYDGVMAFAVSPDGALYAHNQGHTLRRTRDDGENWDTILENVQCCGSVSAGTVGQVFVASPDGLYYTQDDGANWSLWSPDAFIGAALAPDRQTLLATTKEEVRRYDLTGGLLDSVAVPGEVQDLAVCAHGNVSAYTTVSGSVYTTTQPAAHPRSWRIPADRFSKVVGPSSLSFDKQCNLYQGLWNGYRSLRADGSFEPSSTKTPKHLIHVAGYHAKNLYRGTGAINDILAWPQGPVLVGAERGVWGEDEIRNAYRKPYWKTRTIGLDRSKVVRQFGISPTTGYLYVATSSNRMVPKYCRKVRRQRRRRRRRRRRARTNFYYVFCGFKYQYQGGLFRSRDPMLTAKTVGIGGRAFDDLNARGANFDPQLGGLVVTVNEDDTGFMWLPNTAESTISRWDPSVSPPRELAKYRTGLPVGECPGVCCWEDGCNMPSRVALDDAGNAYVANRGFAMQGTVTKIAGRMEDCVDRNNNGVIETSINAFALDYGADECVLWNEPVGPNDAVLRALAIDLGDPGAPDGYVWTGSWNQRRMYKLDPTDGRVIAEVPVNIAPYGAVALSTGEVWVSTLDDPALQSIDAATGEAGPVIRAPRELTGDCRSSYGIGVDLDGRIWLGGWDCPYALGYDPLADTWCRADLDFGLDNNRVGRGISADGSGRVWAALGGDGQSYLAYWNAEGCEGGGRFNVPGGNIVETPLRSLGPSAVAADNEGKIWLAHYQTPRLVRVDPDQGMEMRAFNTNSVVYSYSDITGVVRRLAIRRGRYTEDFGAACDNPTWNAFDWVARVPIGATLRFVAYSANREDKLADGDPVEIAIIPDDQGPINLAEALENADVVARKYLRIRAELIMSRDGESPVLESFSVGWTCE